MSDAMDEIRVLSPTAILGYGFPKSSLEEGLRRKPHVIGVDAGSTDVGPYYLGMEKVSTAVAANSLLERDLRLLLAASHSANIPLLIGSAGLAGADDHLEATVRIIRKLALELDLSFRMAVIRAEIEKSYVKRKLRKNKIVPLGPVPDLTVE